MKIVVVGGGAAGAGAAAKARRTDENARIVVYEQGAYASYANCGLPFHVGNEITDKQDLIVTPPERFTGWYNVELRTLHEVGKIDRTRKVVTVTDLRTGSSYDEGYDKLILALGSSPAIPPIPGVRAENVFTLLTIPDVEGVCRWIEREKPPRAIVIGAGFIGLEAVEALVRRGIHVTLIEKADRPLSVVDREFSLQVRHALTQLGVSVLTGVTVKRFEAENGRVVRAITDSGKEVPCSLVVLATGMRPKIGLAKDAGLEIGRTGGLLVDERMRTSDPDIYAAGDCVETVNLITQEKTLCLLAGPANKEGRVAGANAAGGDLKFPGVLGTFIVRVGELTVAKSGFSEEEAKKRGIDCFVSETHALDHAGYYPGATDTHLKLTIEKDTARLLGAQVAGSVGVDKRIDVLATALCARMKVYDLENLDLAYAPPFSSAKGPEIMAGMAASNIHRLDVRCVTVPEILPSLGSYDLVDVRTLAEYEADHLPGARNIPLEELRSRSGEISGEKPIVVYCRTGIRSYMAYRILSAKGFANVRNLSGGYYSWALHSRGSRNT